MKVAAAKDRVAKLEIAMAAMEGMEGPEVESVRAAHKRALEAVQGVPVDVQVKECESFLVRARSHLAELDSKRATVLENMDASAFVGVEGQVADTSAVGRVGGDSVARFSVPVAGPNRIVAGSQFGHSEPKSKAPTSSRRLRLGTVSSKLG